MNIRSRDSGDPRGQAMVEFALTAIVFVMILVGVFDLGRAVYMYNSVSQAARDIARVTSVHPGDPLGTSTEAQDVVDGHKGLIHGMGDPVFSCVDLDGSSVAGDCLSGYFVKVEVAATYTPATPILNVWTMDLESTSTIQIP